MTAIENQLMNINSSQSMLQKLKGRVIIYLLLSFTGGCHRPRMSRDTLFGFPILRS